jgi:hypothetical protein
MRRPKFEVYRIADISTKHITKEDGHLISRTDAPGHIASVDPHDTLTGSPGDVFAVMRERRYHRSQMEAFRSLGFSKPFLEIFRALRRQGIPYVRFDADGTEVVGLPEFFW